MKQDRRTRASSRISQLSSKLNDGRSRQNVQSFLEQYFFCEIASKEMLVGYRDAVGEPIDYKDAKMDLRKLRPAFDHFGIGLPDDVYRRLFSTRAIGSYRSAKDLRNSIVHRMTNKGIDAVNNQYSQLCTDMDSFLRAVHRE